jgi:hypothetical protein
MRVLIACECSGNVRRAFRAMGHEAYSCDVKPAEDGGEHILVRDEDHLIEIIRTGNWDLLIAHPECRYLCSSGLHWTTRGARDPKLTEDAIRFVRRLLDSPVKHICIENPVGCISTRIRKYDQKIQPYYFGENASKGTCLWLKNLPLLRPTKFFPPRKAFYKGKTWNRWGNQCDSGQNRLGPSATRSADRARTYQGVADAMAAQWGDEKNLKNHVDSLFDMQ